MNPTFINVNDNPYAAIEATAASAHGSLPHCHRLKPADRKDNILPTIEVEET